MPMIAITTNNSMSVNAGRAESFLPKWDLGVGIAGGSSKVLVVKIEPVLVCQIGAADTTGTAMQWTEACHHETRNAY